MGMGEVRSAFKNDSSFAKKVSEDWKKIIRSLKSRPTKLILVERNSVGVQSMIQ